MSEEIKRYALDETSERQLLASLPFVGQKQAEYVRNIANPITRVRAEIHRVYPAAMAAFDADILARVAQPARMAQPARTEQTEQAAELDRLMGIESHVVDHSPRFDGRVQSFGAPPRSDTARSADALDAAFGDEEPATRCTRNVGNTQQFGVKKAVG